MNYRHAFHAGNHADVLKHVVLARVFELMKAKDKPFAFIDAHAGAGTYDLLGSEAGKTLEWRDGIAKMSDPFADDVEALLAPYRLALRAVNATGNSTGKIRRYPGSPVVAVTLLRPKDRMFFNELHPETNMLVEREFAGDKRVRLGGQDALVAVTALLPVTERRAVVLVDPAYEVNDERDRVLRLLVKGVKRMANAVFVIWYPIKSPEFENEFLDAIRATQIPDILGAKLMVREAFAEGGLAGSGLLVVNPPWTLEAELETLLPALARRLGVGTWGQGLHCRITPQR
jgi:23S rRNA (adenine2030-N6)-methyltransferase